jgi:hypothetical protein
MRLREQVLSRSRALIVKSVRNARTSLYKSYPALPTFLGRRFPKLKGRLGQATRTEYQTIDARRRNDEIVSLLAEHSFREITELISSGKESDTFTYLQNHGFTKSTDSFDFKLSPTRLTRNDKSNIEIHRDRNGELLVKVDFFQLTNSGALLARLAGVLTGYWNGIMKILDYESREFGRTFFYLCLEDSYETSSHGYQEDISIYAFSRRKNSLHVGLLPDVYCLAELNASGKFPDLLDREKAQRDFFARENKIFWRGSTTGSSIGTKLESNQRISFCIKALDYLDLFDTQITAAVGNFNSKNGRKKLARSGVMGDAIAEKDFAQYMAYLDLEGYASAWGTMRKYLQHIHILKPTSEYSHFFDFFQAEESHTSFDDFSDLLKRLKNGEIKIDNFEVAHQGYLSALNTLALMRNGDATVFPIFDEPGA